MHYSPKFSDKARAVIEAELIRAGRRHDDRKQQWKSDWPFDDGQSLKTCILETFAAYAREAIALGRHGVWTVDEVRTQALEGLRLITIEVVAQTDYTHFVGWRGYLDSKLQREYEASAEWKEFQDALLALAESKLTQPAEKPNGWDSPNKQGITPGAMEELSELSESTQRKLQIQWDTLLDHYRLTAQDIDRYASANQRIRRIAVSKPPDIPANRWSDSWLIGHKGARQDTGISPTVAMAEVRFTALASEYWLIWESSGTGYETHVTQLAVLRRRVLAEVASIWKGRSGEAFRWYETACAPAVEGALSVLEREQISQARGANLLHLVGTPTDTRPVGLGHATQKQPANVTNDADQGSVAWQSIEISFLSDERVQIRIGTDSETRNYGELGFADRRAKRGKPKLAWVILRAMAEQNGIIRDGANMSCAWPKVEKQMQEIRKALRKQFSIAADPIPFVKGTGYKACFKIGCSPSFHT